jgi:hypothetical protein
MIDTLPSTGSLSAYLVAHISEISYFLATILMFFGGDFLMVRMVRHMRKMAFLTRTLVFIICGIVMLPGLTIAGAYLLRKEVLEPLKDRLILTLAVCFIIVGLLLSFKYNMKLKR